MMRERVDSSDLYAGMAIAFLCGVLGGAFILGILSVA